MKRFNMDIFGGMAILSMLFTLCTSRPAPGSVFAAHSHTHKIEAKIDSVKLKAQSALVQCENEFQAAYLEALKGAKTQRKTIIIYNPHSLSNDTIQK